MSDRSEDAEEKWREGMGGSPLTGDTRDGFFAGQIGDVNEGVVEGCVDMCDAEHELSFCDLGTERDRVLFLWRLDFFGGLQKEDI